MLVEHLQRTFADRSRRNPSYSLRAFSKSLGVDSSTLSAILRRKRPLSAKMAQKLIAKLDIPDPSQSQMLLLGVIGAADLDKTPTYTQIDLETAEVIGSWEHHAILAVLELDHFRADTRAISKRLNIPLGIVIEALTRLEKLGMIKTEGGQWVLTGRNLATPTDLPSAVLKRSHRQNIERGLESMEKDPVSVRDITGMTMAIDVKKLPEAKKLITDFRRKLTAFLETGKKTSVYRLNILLFPLSQEE